MNAAASPAWLHVTNWGNSLFLMPVALAIAIGLVADARAALALRWSAAFAWGVIVVLATKVAFLGWGVGIAPLDFTGFSGHAMLAASVLPMLAWWLAEGRATVVRRAAIAAGAALALLIGWSRLAIDVHSTSEVVLGLGLGFGVATIALTGATARAGRSIPRRIVACALAVAFALPVGGPIEGPHDLVTRIALAWSGHAVPFQRDAL